FPLNAQSDCLLGRLLQQLVSLKMDHIFIIGGYEIDQLESWLENSGISQQNYTLIDARENYQRGPLHSLMTVAQKIRNDSGQYLVCPADTWYSPNFMSEIQEILVKLSPQDGNILFYGKASVTSPLGSMILEIDSADPLKVKNISKFQSSSMTISEKDSSSELAFLLPIMLLSGEFFNQAHKFDLTGYRKAIDFIQILLGTTFQFWAHELPISNESYLDMDTEQDLTEIQKLI
ncbi:MAG: hypothetical protein ACTSYU_05365, partial [Promethearchaeota archaeon]